MLADRLWKQATYTEIMADELSELQIDVIERRRLQK